LCFFNLYCFSQLKNDKIEPDNKAFNSLVKNNFYFSLNQNINLSKNHILVSNNYFKKEIDYFSRDNSFLSKEENYQKQLEKPFALSVFEGVVNGILNNKK